jgi:hypothetical protein
MPAKQVPVCADTPILTHDETFYWVNSGATACVVSQCKPPLTLPAYRVPARGKASATVDIASVAIPGMYPYEATCCGRPQPRIKIGGRLRKKTKAAKSVNKSPKTRRKNKK